MEDKQIQKKSLFKRYKFLAIIIVALLGISLILFTVLGYKRVMSVAAVNSQFVSRNDFNKRVDAQIKYQKEQQKIDFDGEGGNKKTETIKEQVLGQMIEEEVIKQEAKKLNLVITNEDINQEYQKMVEANKGEDKLAQIISVYGYTVEAFKKYNLEPKLLRQKVSEKLVASGDLDKEAKGRADEMLKQLRSGAKFEDLAKSQSQDTLTASKGGNMGLVDPKTLPQEFQKQISSIKVGEVSAVFKTSYGYHIAKYVKKDGAKYQISQILIKPKDVDAWIKEKVSQAKVKKYI